MCLYKASQKQVVSKLVEGSSNASVVPIRPSYISTTELCLTSLALIPNSLSQSIFDNLIQPLQKLEPDHYYYTPDSLHTTIKNVRTVSDPPSFTQKDVEKVDNLFKNIIPQYPSFFFELEEVALFSTSVSLIGYSTEDLKKLVLAMDEGLRTIGVPDNKQYASDSIFFGNITVCRFAHQPSEAFITQVKKIRNSFQERFKVETIHLVTCDAVFSQKSRNIINFYQLKH